MEKLQFCDGTTGKILETRSGAEGSGIIEAYLTKWDTVDSWNTSFKKGAFKKTFAKRGAKGTRLIFNHEKLAGKILEMREDEYGPYVKVQFNLDTQVGKEAYAHIKAGDINCFSFGFNTLKDKWTGQVREILEVDMLECGPVVFEANNKAKITSVRSDGTEIALERIQGKIGEKRDTDFDTTVKEDELYRKGWMLIGALETTLSDIHYNLNTKEDIISAVDTAIATFHVAYLSWVRERFEYYESRGEKPKYETRNALRDALYGVNKDDLAKETSLTIREIELLSSGHLLPLESRHKIFELDESIQKAHTKMRIECVEKLCDELRHSKLTEGEVERIEALLKLSKKDDGIAEAVDLLRQFRSSLQ